MSKTSVTYFQALNRYFNILGVERKLFLLSLALTIPLAFSARFSLYMDAIALIIFLALYVAGLLITKADNQMIAIYRRHITYKKYYAGVSSIHADSPQIKPSVPMYVGKKGLL